MVLQDSFSKMKFISAQPDQTYFIWQLEIQLRNFQSLGITKEQIQVLVSFKPEKGLSTDFQVCIDKNNYLANFYTYPDLRTNPKYTSAIRPHILKQHFEKYPELADETLFYHDSDILFSRIPEIKNIKKDTVCYVSDTRNYLDIGYIRSSSSEQLLMDMAQIVGIPVTTIEKNKDHTGGAQYILKGISATFWEKVERDSEALYALMKDYNRKLWEEEYPSKKEYRSKKRGIQAWCADMWAVLWNLWLADKKTEIHPEMDFSWPYSPIEEWDQKAIQHYSGNIEDKTKYFKKNEYLNYLPWYDESLHTIPKTNCSHKIVELIWCRKAELDGDRACFPNSCIVLDGRFVVSSPNNFRVIEAYLQKHLAIDIYMLATDTKTIEQGNTVNMVVMSTISEQNYDHILYIPLEHIIAISDIQRILQCSDKNQDMVFCPQERYKVDSLFLETFSKVLDIELLYLNKGKFNRISEVSGRYIRYFELFGDTSERQNKLEDIVLHNSQVLQDKVALPISYSFIS